MLIRPECASDVNDFLSELNKFSHIYNNFRRIGIFFMVLVILTFVSIFLVVVVSIYIIIATVIFCLLVIGAIVASVVYRQRLMREVNEIAERFQAKVRAYYIVENHSHTYFTIRTNRRRRGKILHEETPLSCVAFVLRPVVNGGLLVQMAAQMNLNNGMYGQPPIFVANPNTQPIFMTPIN